MTTKTKTPFVRRLRFTFSFCCCLEGRDSIVSMNQMAFYHIKQTLVCKLESEIVIHKMDLNVVFLYTTIFTTRQNFIWRKQYRHTKRIYLWACFVKCVFYKRYKLNYKHCHVQKNNVKEDHPIMLSAFTRTPISCGTILVVCFKASI